MPRNLRSAPKPPSCSQKRPSSSLSSSGRCRRRPRVTDNAGTCCYHPHAEPRRFSCENRNSRESGKCGSKLERHFRHDEAVASSNTVASSLELSGCELSVLETRAVLDCRHDMTTGGASNSSLCSVGRTASSLIPNQGFDCDFTALPADVLRRIGGSFTWSTLWSASRACRSWSQALAPLREAMLFVHWGKKFKHGHGGVVRNLDKALDSFLKAAIRGCAAAMVDAGLLLWDMGRKQEGVYWYRQAAELGDPAGQCNLGLACLQDSINPTEAVKWFQQAASAGHARAQYNLALCLQQGRGLKCNVVKAAHWYYLAAEGGYARAMYNLALCYRNGGVNRDHRKAKRWMQRAALCGHHKAQFEHGLTLFSENNGILALVFLELATRAGETAATQLRNTLLQQLSPKSRAHAISCADRWQAKFNSCT